MAEGLIPSENDIYVVNGYAHRELAGSVAIAMGATLVEAEVEKFPDSSLYVRVPEIPPGKDVVVLEPHVRTEDMSVQDAVEAHVRMVGVAKGTWHANRVIAVAPAIAYARADKMHRPGEAVSADDPIERLKNKGADYVLTVDTHSPELQEAFPGFYIPITAQALIREAVRKELRRYDPKRCVPVAPDAGSLNDTEQHAEALDLPMLFFPKKRDPNNSQNIVRDCDLPDLTGMIAVLFDDMLDTGGTVVGAAQRLEAAGVSEVIVAAVHGYLSDPATKRLENMPIIRRIIVSDTLPPTKAHDRLGNRIQAVQTGRLIGEATLRLLHGKPMDDLMQVTRKKQLVHA